MPLKLMSLGVLAVVGFSFKVSCLANYYRLELKEFRKSAYTGNVTKILYCSKSLALIYPCSGKPIYCAFHFVGEFFNWFVKLHSNFTYTHSPPATLLLNEIS